MMEGHWIAMPGVPLIAAGDPEVAACVEGDGTNAPGDGAHAAEGATGPTFDEVRADRATEPSNEAECAEAAVGTIAPAPASPGAVAVPEEDTAPAPDEVVPATANAEENAGGDASEVAHAAELEATLLAATSPGHEAPPEPTAAEPACKVSLRREPKVRATRPCP
jgi:hypothetical protein